MNKNISKYLPTIQKFNKYLLIFIILLSVSYWQWIRSAKLFVFRFSNYHAFTYIGWALLLIGYIYLFITFKLAFKFKILYIAFFIITLPFCLLTTIFTLDLPVILDTANLADSVYFLTEEPDTFDMRIHHYLYRCDNSLRNCEKTSFYSGGGPSPRPISLLVANNKIHVQDTHYSDLNFLEYTYGEKPRYYDSSAPLGQHIYYLSYDDKESKTPVYSLYECKRDNTDCKRLPIEFNFSIGFDEKSDLTYLFLDNNEAQDEIRVYYHDERDQRMLVAAYGKNLQCFVDGCEILEEKRNWYNQQKVIK